MLVDTLGACLLGNLLAGNGTVRTGEVIFTAGESTIEADQDF